MAITIRANTQQRKIALFYFIVLGVLFPSMTFSQTPQTGGIESPFELGGSARALGMGDTSAAVIGDGNSFFSNPAALAALKNYEILTLHAPLYQDTAYDAVGYVHPVSGHAGLGAAFIQLGTSDILKTQNNILPISTFSSQQMEGVVGGGFRLPGGLDFGASVKYLREQMDTYQGSGVGVDVGLLYRFSETSSDFRRIGLRNLAIGLSASNLLEPQVKLFQAADQPVRVFRPALSYFLQTSGKDTLWLTFEGELVQGGENLIKAGMEYGFNNMIFGRAGFDGISPTLGAGLSLYGFEFDYAFNQRDLGALHRFSLSYRFGAYRDPLQAQRLDLLKWVARSYSKSDDFSPAIRAWKNVLNEYPDDEEAPGAVRNLEKRRSSMVSEQLDVVRKEIKNGNYDKALPLLGKVLSIDPGNPDAQSLLKMVDKGMMLSTNYVRGVEAYSREDYATAVDNLQAVYQIDPEYRDVKFLYHDAESHYQPLEAMPKEITNLYAKGVEAYLTGKYQEAVVDWEKVLAQSPKNFLIMRNLEEAQKRLNESKTPEKNSNSGQEGSHP